MKAACNAHLLGLPEPFPSAPLRPGKYVMYISRGKVEEIHIFAQVWAAKHFVLACLGDTPYVLESNEHLRAENGLFIRSSRMAEIMNHRLSKKEQQWELPTPYNGRAYFLKHGERMEREARPAPMKKERARRPRRERKPRTSREGLVDMKQICADLDCKPRDARAVLRKAKVEKPDAGWAFPPERAEEIKAIIKKGLKKR